MLKLYHMLLEFITYYIFREEYCILHIIRSKIPFSQGMSFHILTSYYMFYMILHIRKAKDREEMHDWMKGSNRDEQYGFSHLCGYRIGQGTDLVIQP